MRLNVRNGLLNQLPDLSSYRLNRARANHYPRTWSRRGRTSSARPTSSRGAWDRQP